MNQGKDICSHLKAIRRTIALENNIPLEMPECTFKGNCAGTCPQCESEVKYLESELAKRISLGKAATVAGIALALATPAAAQEVNKRNTLPAPEKLDNITIVEPRHRLGGIEEEPMRQAVVVKDKRNGERVPFATVRILDKAGNELLSDTTDINGILPIDYELFSKRTVTMEIKCVGYETITIKNPMPKLQNKNLEVNLEMRGAQGLSEVEVIQCEGIISGTECDSLKVKVKY